MGVAFDLGYSDGFSLSNQMKRLLGIRPRHVAARLGWEWVVECWIQEEIREGGFGPASLRALSRTDAPPGSAGPKPGSQEEGQRRRA
jgi:hypothetical protein